MDIGCSALGDPRCDVQLFSLCHTNLSVFVSDKTICRNGRFFCQNVFAERTNLLLRFYEASKKTRLLWSGFWWSVWVSTLCQNVNPPLGSTYFHLFSNQFFIHKMFRAKTMFPSNTSTGCWLRLLINLETSSLFYLVYALWWKSI